MAPGLAALAIALTGLGAASERAAAQSAGGLVFADWTSAGGTNATGVLQGHTVTLSGWHVSESPASQLNGASTLFAGPYFTPPLAHSDAIEIRAENGQPHTYTVQFGAPTENPVLHLGSLGSTLRFPPGTVITRVSGKDAGFAVSGDTISGAGNSAVDAYGENDSNGTVRLSGTFQSISFTATTAYSLDGVYLQVGAAPGAKRALGSMGAGAARPGLAPTSGAPATTPAAANPPRPSSCRRSIPRAESESMITPLPDRRWSMLH